MYDLIVIGAGPAGLTAAIYARRAGKSVLVLEKESFGGQITHSPKVENYPGFSVLSGTELADRMTEQMLALGAEAEPTTVLGIRDAGYTKYVLTTDGEYETKSVIVATGAHHRTLGLPREEELVGEGVSYCAVCDGAFYADGTVAVIGGGNSALQEAVMLSEICKQVYVVQNLSALTGEARLAELVLSRPNVTVICDAVVAELVGETSLEAILIEKTDGNRAKLTVDAIFVAIGQIPENEPFADILALDERGYVISDERCLTDRAGIFVAGDCRTKAIRQVTTACADGAVAALAAIRYLDSFA